MDTSRNTTGQAPVRKSQQTVAIARNEAVAVLREMHRHAEERLVEACAAFQDIAAEMEWRLTEWNRLVSENAQAQKLLTQKRRASLQFNQQAYPHGSDVRNRTALWQKQVALLVRRQRQQQKKIMRLADVIRARNNEGSELLHEIETLQAQAGRLDRCLTRGKKSRRSTAEASARLAVELSVLPDIADPQILVEAADMVQSRLHR